MSKRDIGLTFDSIFLAKHRRIFLFFCVHLPRQKAPSKVPPRGGHRLPSVKENSHIIWI